MTLAIYGFLMEVYSKIFFEQIYPSYTAYSTRYYLEQVDKWFLFF